MSMDIFVRLTLDLDENRQFIISRHDSIQIIERNIFPFQILIFVYIEQTIMFVVL